jgi:hypothetical protein
MPGLLATAVASMVSTLLDTSGSSWTYSRGSTSAAITFYQNDTPSAQDNGNGYVTEITVGAFRGLYSAMGSFGDPQKFDRITNGVLTFEVQPVNDRCFYTTEGMIHIHAKQVRT